MTCCGKEDASTSRLLRYEIAFKKPGGKTRLTERLGQSEAMTKEAGVKVASKDICYTRPRQGGQEGQGPAANPGKN